MEIFSVLTPMYLSDAMPKPSLRALMLTLRDLIRQRRERQLAPPAGLLRLLNSFEPGAGVMTSCCMGMFK